MIKFLLGIITLIFVGLLIYIVVEKRNISQNRGEMHQQGVEQGIPSKELKVDKYVVKNIQQTKKSKSFEMKYDIPEKIVKIPFSDELALDNEFDSTLQEIKEVTVEDIEKYEKDMLEEDFSNIEDIIFYNSDSNKTIMKIKEAASLSFEDKKTKSIKFDHDKFVEFEKDINDLVDFNNKEDNFHDESIVTLIDN